MLNKPHSLHSILRSVQTGALVLAALAGTTAAVQAGEEYSRASNKDKNVIQQAPPSEPKFYLTLTGGIGPFVALYRDHPQLRFVELLEAVTEHRSVDLLK